jgi:hypothetical protein
MRGTTMSQVAQVMPATGRKAWYGRAAAMCTAVMIMIITGRA